MIFKDVAARASTAGVVSVACVVTPWCVAPLCVAPCGRILGAWLEAWQDIDTWRRQHIDVFNMCST